MLLKIVDNKEKSHYVDHDYIQFAVQTRPESGLIKDSKGWDMLTPSLNNVKVTNKEFKAIQKKLSLYNFCMVKDEMGVGHFVNLHSIASIAYGKKFKQWSVLLECGYEFIVNDKDFAEMKEELPILDK